MAYIGNTASTRFVANRAASVYSGNGSTVAFTLEEAVGSDEDILVSVDGVIQEPSVGYAVSSGTTLTFSAAPSSNSGNNIFVYYLSLAKGSVVHPSNVGLTATTGVFSSTAQATVLKGTTSLQSPLIEFTDGDDAIAIADAGIITIKNTSSVITSEGGAATTIIAQGLAKLFAHSNQSSNAIEYGFNTSSYTDVTTGSYILNVTSAFTSKVNLVSTSSSQPQSTSNHCINHMSEGSSTTSAMQFRTIENGSAKDQPFNHNTVHGDLA